MAGIDFPPRDDKKKVLKSFDGLDTALDIKREEESVDGSGVSHEEKQEALTAALDRFEQSWMQADTLYAAFIEGKNPDSWDTFKDYMEKRQSEIENIRDLAKVDPALSAALTPLIRAVDKNFGKFSKAGTSMLGQAIKENPQIFETIQVSIKDLVNAGENDSGAHTVSRPPARTSSADTNAPARKSIRDKDRQARPKGASTPILNAEPGAPTRISNEERERAAQMQAELDAGATVATQEAKGVAEPEKDATTLAPDATHAETVITLTDSLKKHEVLARLNQQKGQREGSEGKFLDTHSELHEKAERTKEVYFQALRAHQRNRSLGDAGLERLGFKKASESEGPANLQALKRGWLEARMEVAKARLEAVVKEREDRGVANPNRTKLSNDAVLARFQRRYVIRDAVMGATAEETKMRAEALSSRDRNIFEWTVKAYKGLPEGVKDVFTQVGLGVGVVGVSAGAAGLVAAGGIGAIAMAPILAGAAIGLKWRADALGLKKKADKGEAAGRPSEEVQRLRAAQQALQARAQFTTFSGVMGWLTGKATKGLQKETRTKAEANISRRDELGNIGSVGVGDLRDADQFEALAKSLERAYASVKQADAQLVTATTVGSVVGGIAVGAGYGAGVHGVDSMFHHDTPAVATTDHPTAPDGLLGQAAVIDRPGEGFGQLIVDLKQSLASVENPSPALKHFLDTNVNRLDHDLLVAKDGTSLTMQAGDKAFFDNDQNMWFQRQGGEPYLVYENSPSAPGGFIEHDIHGHMQADAVRPEAPTPEVARAVAPEGGATSPEDPSAALNRAQLGGSPIPETLAARTDYADGAGINTLTQPQSLDTSGSQVPEAPAEQASSVPSEALVAPPAQPQAPEAVPASAPTSTAPEQAPTPTPVPEARVEVPHTPAEALAGGAVFTNGHNIEITPATPEIYYSPTANGEVGYMYGGPGDTAFKAAQQYVEENPGTSIRFFALDPEGKAVTGAFFSDASGASHPMLEDPATDKPFDPPDLDAVTRKVDFNYRPVR